jgi:dihydrodipicolinate reductase
MSQVRAKFKVNSVQENEDGSKQVSMSPVTSGSEENKSFWEATPSGSIELYITNPDASFDEGSDYFVDFTKAEVTSETAAEAAGE